MLEISRNRYIFNTKEIWFSDYPYNIKNCHAVMFRGCKNNIDIDGFKKEPFDTLVIDLRQDLETIWRNMSKSSCRYSINRAKREGIKIFINSNHAEFYKINESFTKDKHLRRRVLDVDFMKKNGTLFVSEFNGEMLGGQLYLEDKNNIRWLIGASKRLSESKIMATLIGNANRYMIWEAIQYAKRKGILEFDMGGYYTGSTRDEQKEKINSFKKSFGGVLETHYIYKQEYSGIYKCLKKISHCKSKIKEYLRNGQP